MAVGLAACGESPGTRAVTGGLIGAGGGAAVGSLAGGHAGTGATHRWRGRCGDWRRDQPALTLTRNGHHAATFGEHVEGPAMRRTEAMNRKT